MSVAPGRTLIVLSAVVVVPLLAIAVALPEEQGFAIGLAIAALIGVAAADAWRSRHLLGEVKLDVPTPLRATVGKRCILACRIINAGRCRVAALRLGVEFPDSFHLPSGAVVALPKPMRAGDSVAVELEVVAGRRGAFDVDTCHLETRSILGLWEVRRCVVVAIEFRVYPDLRSERRALAAVFLRRGEDGSQALRQIGKGREFDRLREYVTGDDYGDIDWKATSRRGQPITRSFQIERTQEIYVVVDHSRLSAREIRQPLSAGANAAEFDTGTGETVSTQLDAFLNCALVLSSVAHLQGDLFGFVGFARSVDCFIRSGGGAGHYPLVRDALYTLEPEAVAPDFEDLMVTLNRRLTRRSLLVMLVDLADPLTAETFFEALPIVARRHVVVVAMVRPPLAAPLFSDDTPPDSTDAIYQRLAGHLQWRDLRALEVRLHRLGVELALPDHASLSAEAVSRYLRVKRRQLL